ncbi:recombinase family protein [Herbivorax sp. ANBcel31]|uniref:recombinase family protein n=1 Tax=Herbivorax sp. ANBcel31 TaxID=3069754 RepID=UPI0027AF03BA|nr:recombinase family protein [Herbivorax sp. ANBcel31]MDQ2085013.1 recombinase family protein [Herbivorax sp. ANBcel31]
MYFYKVGIYVRESRDDGEENYETIETQKDLLVNYIKNSELGEVQKIYIDDNVSGAGFERRGIEELREDVLNNRINLLVIKDLSRLGRNNAKTLLFLDFLEEHGVRVRTFDGRYDSLKDNDTVGIDTWYNERYIRDISKKIRATLRFKIEKGEYIGRAPYGYVKSVTEKNKLLIKREEAEVVKKIYNLYGEGYGYGSIADFLNKEGYESPRKGLWNSTTVRRIICNSVYAGDTVQGVSEKISFKSKKTRRLPQSSWIVTGNTHEGIIERGEYEKIQEIRKKRSEILSPHKGKLHTFRGLLYCGGCGSLMYARKRNQRPMGYICSCYSKKGKSLCTSHHICERDLSEIILKDLINFFSNKDIADIISKRNKLNSRDFSIDIIKKQIECKKRQQEIIYQDKLEKKISEELFLRVNKQIEKKLLVLRKEVENTKKRNFKIGDINSFVENIKNNLYIKGITHEITRLIVNKIVIFEKGEEYIEKLWNLNITKEQERDIKKNGAVIIEYILNF